VPQVGPTADGSHLVDEPASKAIRELLGKGGGNLGASKKQAQQALVAAASAMAAEAVKVG
jgi:hypothetical protein